MAIRVVFIGPPGSGKGTQAVRLVQHGFVHISTGDLLRAEIARGTPQGQKLLATVRAGGLVDDEILFRLIHDVMLAQADSSIVFDGYPRTLAQAHHLDRIGIDAAFFFLIADAVLLRRLRSRVIGNDGVIYDLEQHPPPAGVTYYRRVDDTEAVHLQRLREYRCHENWLRDFYRERGLFYPLAAEAPVDSVASRIADRIRALRLPALRPETAPP